MKDISNFLLSFASNDQLPLRDAPAEIHGTFVDHLELNIYFDVYNYHNSLHARLIEGIGN